MNTIHNAIERRNYLGFDVLVKQKIGLDKHDKKGLTPLMKANHEPNKRNATEMVRLLLLQKADITRVDSNGRTSLMHAALVGNAASCRLILDAGYNDPVLRDRQGNSALHYAGMGGDLETTEVILQELKNVRIKADLRNDQGMTPLHVACSQGHIKTARFLHFNGNCSLVMRDSVTDRSARDWLDEVCDLPQYMDAFNINADIEGIAPKTEPEIHEFVDTSKIRIFLFMKDKPDIDDEPALPNLKPPWDISTNLSVAPKWTRSGTINTYRYRKTPAPICDHYKGPRTLRPFSAPCGYPEYSQWKHPMDMQPYLSYRNMNTLRRYSSVTDVRKSETCKIVKEQAEKLLSRRR